MALKIKDKKNYLDETVFRQFYDNKITGVFLRIKDPDPVFSRIRIRVAQKDRIRNTDLNPIPTSRGRGVVKLPLPL